MPLVFPRSVKKLSQLREFRTVWPYDCDPQARLHARTPMVMLNIDQTKALLKVSRTTIYVLMKRKKFPRPVKILSRSLWRRDQVESWIRRQAGAKA